MDREREGSVAGSEGSERMQSHYPDDQQVFVGNLPHRLTEADLKKFLEGELNLFGLVYHIYSYHSFIYLFISFIISFL